MMDVGKQVVLMIVVLLMRMKIALTVVSAIAWIVIARQNVQVRKYRLVAIIVA